MSLEGGTAAPPAVDSEALMVGGKSAGHIRPMVYHFNAPGGDVLLLAAFVFALAYGLVFFRRAPSPVKTIVKTSAVAALAGVSWLNTNAVAELAAHSGYPTHQLWLLPFALSLCAVGDAFLALDPKRWLPFGLAAFLAGHLAYVALFVTTISAYLRHRGRYDPPLNLPPDIGHLAAMGAVVVVALGMLAWLWPSLGKLRAAVCAYVAAIVAMVCASLALPPFHEPAQFGAMAFFASDGILSAQLFKQRFTGVAGQWAVWGLYFIGQFLILSAFSPATF